MTLVSSAVGVLSGGDITGALKSVGMSALQSLLGGLGNFFLGNLGSMVFQVSQAHVNTFESFSRQFEASFADHEVAGGKPVSEFTGPGLDIINMVMVFNAGLGVSPTGQSDKLRQMALAGTPQPLVIAGRMLGRYTIRTVEDEWSYVLGGGPAIIAVAVTMAEYIESVPSQAQSKQREDELRREDTGKGGPERLPGAKEATEARKLTPKTATRIDPVTRLATGGDTPSPTADDDEDF